MQMKRMETKPIFFIAFVNRLTANVFSECKACTERVLLDVTPPPTTAALLLALGSNVAAVDLVAYCRWAAAEEVIADAGELQHSHGGVNDQTG